MNSNTVYTDADPLSTLLDDDAALDRLVQEAMQAAVQEHKRRGQSVVVWQNGQVVTLPPEDIPPAERQEDST